MDKSQLRKWAKKIRSELDIEALSKLLADKLKQTQEYQQAKNVMIFHPLKDEINLLSLLDDEKKAFFLPKIEGDSLLCCRFDKDTELCESCFHTMEPVNKSASNTLQSAPSHRPSPTGRESYTVLPDLIVVPALAVDKNNYRLGYGKGFYDRFLSKFNNNIRTIVCIPKQLILETIFPNEYDIPVDIVITD